jgi:hypothetical protein
MKMNSKPLLCAIGVALFIVLAVPFLIFAQSSSTESKKVFCDKIADLSAKVSQRISDQETKINEKKKEIENRILNYWVEQDAKLTEKRKGWDEGRTAQYAKLEELAATDAQKQAVTVFKEQAGAAISARRASINVAVSAFRQGLQQAKDSRKIKISATVTAYKNSVNAAFQKAQNSCASGAGAAAIRQNLVNDLRAAKEKYSSDKQSVGEIKDGVLALVTTRKTAIEKAIQDFKTAMESARFQLKTAFVQNTATTTPE